MFKLLVVGNSLCPEEFLPFFCLLFWVSRFNPSHRDLKHMVWGPSWRMSQTEGMSYSNGTMNLPGFSGYAYSGVPAG